jgi:hypothetical protein
MALIRFELGNFELESGVTLPDAKLAFKTFGGKVQRLGGKVSRQRSVCKSSSTQERCIETGQVTDTTYAELKKLGGGWRPSDPKDCSLWPVERR